jgi:hypothetical protein
LNCPVLLAEREQFPPAGNPWLAVPKPKEQVTQ